MSITSPSYTGESLGDSSSLFQSQKDPMLVEKIMNDLDSNKDNEVDFNEFVVLVAALTVACNDFFQEQKKKNK